MDILSWLAPANLISSTGRFAYPVFDPPRVREPVLACPADEYLKAVSEYGIVGVTVYHDFDTEGPLRERLERAARKKYGVPYDEASDVDPDDSWAREKAIKDEALRRQNRLETVYNYLAGFPQKIISVYGLYQTRREPAGEPLYRFEETSFLIPFGLVGGPKALAIARSVFDEFPQSVGRESVLFQPGKDMAADNLDLKGGVLYYLEPDGGVRIAAAEGITADFVETWSGKTTLEGPRGVRFYDEPGAVTSYRVYSYGISNEPGRFGAMTWGGKMAALQGLVEREKKKHDA